MTVTGPDMVRLLTPAGERVEHPGHSLDVTPEALRALYRDMALARHLDVEAHALQRRGELGRWAPLLGREAAQIGSAHALRETDMVFPGHREHGVAWCRGIDPVTLMGMFRGVSNGGWDPRENGFHLYTLVAGSQTPHAVGYAQGITLDGSDEAVLTYFDGGAASQGDVAEAFTFASVSAAPVVFFCQNDHRALSRPAVRGSRAPIHQRASGHGFPGVRVDGNDVLACLAVTRWALEHARSGLGPVLVEAATHRRRGCDPIARLRTYLLRAGAADGAFVDEVESEGRALAGRVRDEVRGMPDPEPSEIFAHVHADGHALVDEERRRSAAVPESFESPGSCASPESCDDGPVGRRHLWWTNLTPEELDDVRLSSSSSTVGRGCARR